MAYKKIVDSADKLEVINHILRMARLDVDALFDCEFIELVKYANRETPPMDEPNNPEVAQVNVDAMVSCHNCQGTGNISYNPNLNPNLFPGSAYAKCTRCNGTGIEDDTTNGDDKPLEKLDLINWLYYERNKYEKRTIFKCINNFKR
jgi:hypothetical protein